MSNALTWSRARLRERWPDALAFLALALVCWVLARWTWVLFAPTPPAAAPLPAAHPSVQTALDEVLRAGLFSSQAPIDRPVATSGPQSDLRLVGVLAAAPQGRGLAVLQLGGKPQNVTGAGAEIAPGLTLHHVYADHVVVRREGMLERIDLARRVLASPAPDPGFSLNVQQRGVGDYAFSRTEFDRALRATGPLANLGALSVSAEAGVRIDKAPSGSLAERLGLRPGDIIRSVNGQRIQSEDDLRRLYEQFSRTQQTAWVVFEGQRNEAPLRLRYTVQP